MQKYIRAAEIIADILTFETFWHVSVDPATSKLEKTTEPNSSFSSNTEGAFAYGNAGMSDLQTNVLLILTDGVEGGFTFYHRTYSNYALM